MQPPLSQKITLLMINDGYDRGVHDIYVHALSRCCNGHDVRGDRARRAGDDILLNDLRLNPKHISVDLLQIVLNMLLHRNNIPCHHV